MADATAADDAHVTFTVKSANDQKIVLTLPTSTPVAELKEKLATSEHADIPVDRQRLIYSGRVLKDHDTLATVKIKDGHTIHLVKGAASNARQNPANQGSVGSGGGSSTQSPQVPTNLAAGTGTNPLADLTGARYAGFHGLPGADMFGPDGGMGSPPDPSQFLEMMDNPMFLSQMNEALDNPAVVDMLMNNPQMRSSPMLRQMLQNPEMRRLLFNPEMIRMQLQLQREMGGDSGGQRMAAPGITENTPQPSSTATGESTTSAPNQPNTTSSTQPTGGVAAANPFANIFGVPSAQQNQDNTNSTSTASPPPANPLANPFGPPSTASGGQQQSNPLAEMTRQMMQDPEAMRAAMNMLGQMQGGGGGGGFNPFGAAHSNPNTGTANTPGTNSPAPNPFAALLGTGGFGAGGGFGTPPPQDSRPPEEVYEQQLRQLNEMGFYDFDRNVSALRRSGGNVQGAVEYLFSGDS